jgi:cell division septation protein DedD
MRGVFDDDQLERAKPRRDTEFTLGSGALLGFFLGLVLLCGLCFGLGYAVGHHSSPEPAAASLQAGSAAQNPTQAAASRPKPSAIAPTYAAPPPARAVVNLPPSSAVNTNSVTNSVASSQPVYPSASGSVPNQAQVKPALPPQAESPQPVTGPGGNLTVEPAIAPAGLPMVQIAAVSEPEDAEVLVNALRKRGYAVSARREATDHLIHVRIGPFASRDEANRWRQRLLNDGYNAILQP